MQNDFEQALALAQTYEALIAEYMRAQGWWIFPTKDYAKNGAPVLLGPNGATLIVPDLFCVRGAERKWVEVKFKTDASFNIIRQRWTMGVARRLWENYFAVREATGLPVELLFWLDKEREIRHARIEDIEISHKYIENKVDFGGSVFVSKDSIPVDLWMTANFTSSFGKGAS